MKPFLVVTLIFLCQLAAGQDNITIHKKKTSLSKIFASIQKQSGYTFWYQDNLVQESSRAGLNVTNAEINDVMKALTIDQVFTFEIKNKVIVLRKKPAVILTSTGGGTSASTITTNNESGGISNGYQKIDSQQATGSYSRMRQDELDRQRQGSGSILDRLNSIPGLTYQKDAKGNSTIVIRGSNSFEGPTSPLIVLDGFPFEGDINQINVNTIEDISVLKDAAASSIWGSRGGNGVIVITTKRASFSKEPIVPLVTILRQDGRIHFNKAHLATIMKHITDNYKLEVRYEGKVPEAYYIGDLSNDVTADELLDLLLAAGVNLHKENNLVTVSGLKN